MASDGRKPPKTANTTLAISVTRDESRPEFQDTPYAVRVSENAEVDSIVYTVRATDQDVQVSGTYYIVYYGRVSGILAYPVHVYRCVSTAEQAVVFFHYFLNRTLKIFSKSYKENSKKYLLSVPPWKHTIRI